MKLHVEKVMFKRTLIEKEQFGNMLPFKHIILLKRDRSNTQYVHWPTTKDPLNILNLYLLVQNTTIMEHL